MNIFDKANIESTLKTKLNASEILAYRFELNKLELRIPKESSKGQANRRRLNSRDNWFDFDFDITNVGGKELYGLLLKPISANSKDELKEIWKRELREVKIKNITR